MFVHIIAEMSQLIAHVTLRSCFWWANRINTSKSIACKGSMLFIVSLTARYTCSMRPRLWCQIQTDRHAFNSFLTAQGLQGKPSETKGRKKERKKKQPTLDTISLKSQEPIKIKQASQLWPHGPDWILMGSYDVASSEAEELRYNRLIYFSSAFFECHPALNFFMFYFSDFVGFI